MIDNAIITISYHVNCKCKLSDTLNNKKKEILLIACGKFPYTTYMVACPSFLYK